jgi:hypothetical protein
VRVFDFNSSAPHAAKTITPATGFKVTQPS